jgi:nitrogen fixation/metabolism regulation signal transduction histidine kinase
MAPSFFQRLSLRAKLYLNLGVLWVVLGAVCLFANFALSIASGQSQETLQTSVRQAELAAQAAEHTLQCRRYEKDVFLNVRDPAIDDDYAVKWRGEFDSLSTALAEFQAAASGTEDRETAESWKANASQYHQAMEGVFRGVKDKTIQSPEQANAALTPFKEPIRKMTDSSLETSRTKMSKARQAQIALTEATGFLKGLILIVTAAAVIGSLIWSYLLAADLIRPIKALSAAAVRFGEGDLFARVDLDRGDELGKLADCFNQMTARIRERTEEEKP